MTPLAATPLAATPLAATPLAAERPSPLCHRGDWFIPLAQQGGRRAKRGRGVMTGEEKPDPPDSNAAVPPIPQGGYWV